MDEHDVVAWTALIQGYAHNARGEIALELFSRMVNEGCWPNSYTFVAAFKACTSLAMLEEEKSLKMKALEKGMAVHSEALKHDHSVCGSLFVGNSLIDMYAKCGDLEDSCRVFDKMNRRSVVSWTALMLGHALNGEEETALNIFEFMQAEELQVVCEPPDRSTFLAALKACIGLAAKEGSDRVKLVTLEMGMAVHSLAEVHHCASDNAVANSLVTLYAKCGSLVDAQRGFDRIRKPDVISWTSLMNAYVENGEAEVALQLFSLMQSRLTLPDEQSFVAALQASGSIASLESGKAIHLHICRNGVETDPVVASTLVDFYGQCSNMAEAQQVFDSLPETRSIVLWNSLAAGYSRQGDAMTVSELLERMEDEGLLPNKVTLLSVLSSCGRGGFFDKGKRYFSAMVSRYGLVPGIEHYHSLLDILGRGNQLEAAVAVVKEMPFRATVVTWITILSACRQWKDLAVARMAFESLLGLNRKVDAAYLLMETIYASLGMWEEQAEVDELRRQENVLQTQCCWWTDESGRIHKFRQEFWCRA